MSKEHPPAVNVRTIEPKAFGCSLYLIAHILLNGFMGIGAFIGLIFAGFSGNLIFTWCVFVALCLTGFILSWVASKRFPKYFWAFGICYILIPFYIALFTRESSHFNAKANWLWSGTTVLLYLASLAGGIRGKNKSNK